MTKSKKQSRKLSKNEGSDDLGGAGDRTLGLSHTLMRVCKANALPLSYTPCDLMESLAGIVGYIVAKWR